MFRSYSLLAATYAPWVTASFPVIRLVLFIMIVAIAAALILLVLIQPSADSQGGNVLSGSQSDTYYGKNKSEMRESIMKRLTIILGITLFVLVVLFFVTLIILPGDALL